jgi:hypothetical protein
LGFIRTCDPRFRCRDTSAHKHREGKDWSQMMADRQDEHTAIADFERHIDEVRGYVPSHRLLVYEVRQGWKPLCDFLQVHVPDEPFPASTTARPSPSRI